MALFGGKPKKIDTQALQDILNRGADKQTGLVEGAFAKTPALLSQFEKTQGQLGTDFVTGATQRAQEFGRNLTNIDNADNLRRQQAKARELAFRNLPATQQAIRENLAATGGINRGAAIRALQQPVLQAAQRASDQGFQLQQQAEAQNQARQATAIKTIFETGQGAALQKLGIDEATAQTLLKTGRADILERAFKLAGIEAGRTQGLLDIEQLRQTQEIARDQAKQARRGALLGSIGSLAGAGLGGFLAPGAGFSGMGALLGSSVGGQAAGLAGGSNPIDLSGILTALALRRNSPQADTGPQFNDALSNLQPPKSNFVPRTLR